MSVWTLCRYIRAAALPGLGRFALFTFVFHATTPAFAQDDRQLIDLINAYRATPSQCNGVIPPSAKALVPDTALATVQVASGTDLRTALKNAGYLALEAEAIVASGPSNATAAMRAIRERYCRSLVKAEYTAIGIARRGNSWQILLTRPLLDPALGDALAAGKKVLELVNVARSKPRSCGDKRFPAVKPLTWNDMLAQAALGHSKDMAARNYFQHASKEGIEADQRAQQAGYRWRQVGENIAAGQGSPEDAVAGWLSSPGHCANIMNAVFTEMGAAYVVNARSDYPIYWTQVFGTPR